MTDLEANVRRYVNIFTYTAWVIQGDPCCLNCKHNYFEKISVTKHSRE